MYRTGGAGQVVDLVHLQENGIDNVVPKQLETRISYQVQDVLLATRVKVIQADYLMARSQQAAA